MKKKLYVGNIPWSATEEDLTELFGAAGNVVSASIVMDRETGRSRGFAFIEMEDELSAQRAIDSLDGLMMGSQDNERKISVSTAREKPKGAGGARGGRGYGSR